MKTSLIRKTIDSDYGNITIECQSQNTTEDSIVISNMNDSVVVGFNALNKLIEHLTKLKTELDL